MSNAVVRTAPSARVCRRRRRMRALLLLTMLWTLLLAWALSSALSGIGTPTTGARVALPTEQIGDAPPGDIDDGIGGGVQISVDTEGALADVQQASEAALYVSDR
jgi:hypothetical protein